MIQSVAQALNDCLESVFSKFQSTEILTSPKILLAYSGGLDSSVLLHALHQARDQFNFAIEAVHIDHQLHKESAQWSQQCKHQCANYKIHCHVSLVEIDKTSGHSLEEMARESRYKAINQKMDASTYLFTAHHADDQFETFLMQFFRGAGPKGLSAMALSKDLSIGKHLRPLLNISRQQLEDYAAANNLVYIDDPSNRSNRFDRNFLRNDIIPRLIQRYPGIKQAVLRSVKHIATEHYVLDRLVHDELKKMSDSNVLYLENWKQSAPDLKSLLLRKWISLNYMQLPSTKILNNLSLQLERAHAGSKTCVTWSKFEIRTYQNRAYIFKQFDELDYYSQSGTFLEVNKVHDLKHGLGEIRFNCDPAPESGLRLAFRQGGEVLRESGHKHHMTIKQMFQKSRVLPWMRSRIPLLFHGEQLVAVGDLWINADWLEQQNNPDFKVRWDNRPQIFTKLPISQIEALDSIG